MKKIFIIFFICLIVCGVCCKKDVERGELVKVTFTEHNNDGWTSLSEQPADSISRRIQRGSLAFNGAVSHKAGITSYQTTFNKTKSNCEVFGDYSGIQGMIRNGNGPALDYNLGRNVIPIGDGAAMMYKINTFKWYFNHLDTTRNVERWRIAVNNDPVAEYDVTREYEDAYVGFGMCFGTLKETIWQPAFVFNGVATNNISPFWGGRGMIRIDLANNKVEGSER